MAVLSKTFEATTSNQHSSLKQEISLICNKLFFETFPDAILQLKPFCSLSSCWEIQYLLCRYLHRDMALHDINASRMAVPVFQSLEKYFKMIDLKDIKVIEHLVIFKTAITSLRFCDKCSVETNFSRALFAGHYKTNRKIKICTRDGDDFSLSGKENRTNKFIPSMGNRLPVLRLRGGAGGDEEKWLCDICGKSLVSKRNLDQHVDSIHGNHPDFTCITTADGLLNWKCNTCNNFLSSKQRVISNLAKTHGKTSLLGQELKQTLNSRTTLWRRKRSADGCFVPEQSSSIAYFEQSLTSESCSTIVNELPVPEGVPVSSALSFNNFSQTISGEESQNFAPNAHGQNEPTEISGQNNEDISNCPDSSNSDFDSISCMDASYTSDSDCSTSSNHTDYSSSETEDTSSDESDSEQQQDKSKPVSPDNVKVLSEKEKLSLLILSYIAKFKLSGSASVDLLDLLKLIAPEDTTLQSLTLSEIKETLGDCIINVYDYCGKCFAIFPKDENIYQCNTADSGGNQCTGLRYRGRLRNQAKKQRTLYFVTVSLEQHLTKLLERGDIWAKIQQYKNKPNSTSIRDIVDGRVYKKFKESGGFLANGDNLTLLFNTDGIPLYKS